MTDLITATPSVVLAIYAHPDDADVACGGALRTWTQAGAETHLVVCTDGGKGTFDPTCKPADLADRRAGELAEAAALLGLASHHVIGIPDGELEQGSELVGTLVTWIRRLQPDVVVGHDPTAVFFGQEYVNHRDHRAAGWALLDSLAPASALPHYFPEAGPPHQVENAYLSGTLDPDVWVDVSAAIETKVQAVECHRSQFELGEEGWAGAAVRRRAEDEGRRAGVAYAEGFRRLRLG